MFNASYFPPAAFFCSAQRRFTASAIRLRPSGVRFRFFLATFLVAGAAALLVFAAAAPPSRARACCNWAISRSSCARISETPTVPPRAYFSVVSSPWSSWINSPWATTSYCKVSIRNCRLFYKQKMHLVGVVQATRTQVIIIERHSIKDCSCNMAFRDRTEVIRRCARLPIQARSSLLGSDLESHARGGKGRDL